MEGKNRMGLMLLGCMLLFALLPGERDNMQTAVTAFYQEKEGYTLVSGYLEGEKMQQIDLSAASDTNLLTIADAQHPAHERMGSRSVRGMVGNFLPVEGDIRLQPEAIYALCDMEMEQALEKGCSLIRGHMSEEMQKAWQQDAVERFQAVGLGREAAIRKVPAFGESDHCLGYSFDVKLTGKEDMGRQEPILRNETGRWLKENLWRYGFLYEENFTACEGIHVRYVGKSHALLMHLTDMGLQEYLAFLQQQKAVRLEREGELILQVQCLPEEAEWAQIPLGMAWSISRDNEGHIILWAYKEADG